MRTFLQASSSTVYVHFRLCIPDIDHFFLSVPTLAQITQCGIYIALQTAVEVWLGRRQTLITLAVRTTSIESDAP